MKRIGVIILTLACFVSSAQAQFGYMANQLTEMLSPALSGSFNYKGFVDVAYLAGLGEMGEKADILEVTTTQGFKYASWCYIGVGAGVNVLFPQSSYSSVKNDVGVMVPLYSDFRFNIGKPNQVSMFIDMKLGASFVLSSNDFYVGYFYMYNDPCLYLKPSLGIRLPLSAKNPKLAVNLAVSYQLITPRFSNGSNINFNNLGATLAFEW